ncbi:TlpA family protein disulfide reductase [Cryptosporangium phraense]|uniref:TlpA family protein disulfide reductase n=1 Tax=Cryptosporangium phraense TaxID=2593070 RepID=A0A545AGG6_9ACTN|nr:TlpA disulfide reductase family protein [Cryptosporangium phraense]TQS39745.1 TlpA family protein disulfide reductase [Cryptosporangium phraense]
MFAWIARGVALAALAALAACSTGADAVDQESGGSNRFVAGSGASKFYDAGDRTQAPNISGTLLDGGTFALDQARGDVVVFNFWGSWCAPCRAEADDLERVYTATKASGVRFVGVNVKDTESRAKAFDVNFKMTYPSLFDSAGRVALQLKAVPPNAIPATIIVDRQGRIAAVFRKGLLDDELQPVVERVAAEK